MAGKYGKDIPLILQEQVGGIFNGAPGGGSPRRKTGYAIYVISPAGLDNPGSGEYFGLKKRVRFAPHSQTGNYLMFFFLKWTMPVKNNPAEAIMERNHKYRLPVSPVCGLSDIFFSATAFAAWLTVACVTVLISAPGIFGVLGATG